jgi:hypothetical protein
MVIINCPKPRFLLHVIVRTCYYHHYLQDLEVFISNHTQIVINVLDREEGVDRDIALLIADGVFNRLKSSNISECVRIARLAGNDSTQINRIVDVFAKYGMR